MENPVSEPRRASAATIAGFAAAIGALAFVFACHEIYDSDFWWHLATGRWILANHRIPLEDPFSFATIGSTWVPHYWLPDVVMALVYRGAGSAGIILLKAAVIGSGFAAATAFAIRAGVQPWLAAFALAAAVPVASFEFQERPHALMFLLVPLLHGMLARPAAERDRRTWVVLAALMVVWVNVHPSFLLGLVLAATLLAERVASFALATARGDPARDGRGVALSAALLALLSLTSVVNAFGVRLPLLMIEDFSRATISHVVKIQEFQPINWSDYPAFTVLVAATAASFLAAGRRARPYALGSFAALTFLAWRSVRFAGVAALLDAAILARNLQPLVDFLATRLPRPSRRLQAAVLGPVLVVASALAFRATFAPGRELRFGLGVHESMFPGAAVKYLADARFEGNLFNTWDLGGYVLWHLPAAKDLVDGRALRAHFDLLDRLEALDPAAVGRWVAEHDVKGALLARYDHFVDVFAASGAYERAFFDDRAVVFLRKDVLAGSGAVRKYRFIQPENFDPSYLVPIARGPQAAEAEAELRRAVADAPESFAPRFLLGFFLEVRGSAECLDQYIAAAKLNPGLAFGHSDLGMRAGNVAIVLGQTARIEPLLREALRTMGDDPDLEAMLGTSLYAQRKFAEAEVFFRTALGSAPDLPLALTNLAYVYMATDRAHLAVPLFQHAVRVVPRSEDPAYGLALALQASGDGPGARRAWREFLAAFPSSSLAPKARVQLARYER